MSAVVLSSVVSPSSEVSMTSKSILPGLFAFASALLWIDPVLAAADDIV